MHGCGRFFLLGQPRALIRCSGDLYTLSAMGWSCICPQGAFHSLHLDSPNKCKCVHAFFTGQRVPRCSYLHPCFIIGARTGPMSRQSSGEVPPVPPLSFLPSADSGKAGEVHIARLYYAVCYCHVMQ